MVSDRLKQVFDAVGATNGDIARYAGIDTSMVSRIKSGSRSVRRNSVSVARIAEGLYLYCDDKNLLPELCGVFGGNVYGGRKKTTEKLIGWLFEGVDDPVLHKQKKKKQLMAVTGTRLDKLMQLTGVSNVWLARITNVDNSYISRIRHGVRTPSPKTELLKRISAALAERAFDKGNYAEVERIIGIPSLPAPSADALSAEIHKWLTDELDANLSPAAELLLDTIVAFSPESVPQLPDASEIAAGDISPVYRGTDGLRDAVIRFLQCAARTGGELWLYSDQDMEWLMGDSEFRLKWISLMTACVKGGVKIKIIHNIDRNINEMLSAITNWLPLYMYGAIEPYYCSKQTDERFSHTLFLNKGRDCIFACHIRGCEDGGFYNYFEDNDRLMFYETEYSVLLKQSKPLVKMHGLYSTDIITPDAAGNMTAIRETLSLATMPEELARAMIERSGLDTAQKSVVLSAYYTQRSAFISALDGGYVCELIPRFSAEDIRSLPSDIPNVCYTKAEFDEHIKSILRLMEEYASYRVCILPEMPFENMRITCGSTEVTVSRMIPPRTSFVFSHPLMLSAFDSYSSRLRAASIQDKVEVRGILSGYIG